MCVCVCVPCLLLSRDVLHICNGSTLHACHTLLHVSIWSECITSVVSVYAMNCVVTFQDSKRSSSSSSSPSASASSSSLWTGPAISTDEAPWKQLWVTDPGAWPRMKRNWNKLREERKKEKKLESDAPAASLKALVCSLSCVCCCLLFNGDPAAVLDAHQERMLMSLCRACGARRSVGPLAPVSFFSCDSMCLGRGQHLDERR